LEELENNLVDAFDNLWVAYSFYLGGRFDIFYVKNLLF
jgi:hypothetical protein